MRFVGKSASIIIGIGIISCTSPAIAKHKHTYVPQPTYDQQALVARINQLIQQADPNAAIGIQVKSMKNNDLIYSKHANESFIPASIAKVLTAEAALLFLGSDYTFSTAMVSNAKSAQNGKLNGDLYLVHSGDPSLTYNDLTNLMISLKSQQIQRITGNVYVDTTAYDQMNYGPGWIWSDTRFCYSAPINASIINHNCLTFKIAPAKALGRKANVIPIPNFYYPGIENSVITRSPWAKSCYIRLNAEKNNIISISGCMPKGQYAQGASVVINNIVQYNKSLLQSLFKRYGIKINNPIQTAAAPPNLATLAVHDSQALNSLISDMLKDSDNIIAGSLFKKLGQLYFNKPGSWKNGSLAVANILAKKASVNTWGMNLVDGSGLSRDNQVTPAQIMQVLNTAYHNQTSYDFISALPIAGVDGTLKHRLKNKAWKVRAKTGTITGVASLAGYALTKDKESLAFVIIINGRTGNVWQYRELEDKIVTALTNFSRGNKWG